MKLASILVLVLLSLACLGSVAMCQDMTEAIAQVINCKDQHYSVLTTGGVSAVVQIGSTQYRLWQQGSNQCSDIPFMGDKFVVVKHTENKMLIKGEKFNIYNKWTIEPETGVDYNPKKRIG